MTRTSPDRPALPGFEARLLAALKEQAESPAPPPARRRAHRSRLTVLALVGAGTVVVGTAAAAGVLPGSDPGKQAIERRPGAHVGPAVASGGGWTVYAAPRPDGSFDVQLAGDGLEAGSVSAAAGPALESSVATVGDNVVVFGRVRAPGAERLEVALGDGTRRALDVGRHGFFVMPLGQDEAEAAGSARLVARDGAGRSVADGRAGLVDG